MSGPGPPQPLCPSFGAWSKDCPECLVCDWGCSCRAAKKDEARPLVIGRIYKCSTAGESKGKLKQGDKHLKKKPTNRCPVCGDHSKRQVGGGGVLRCNRCGAKHKPRVKDT